MSLSVQLIKNSSRHGGVNPNDADSNAHIVSQKWNYCSIVILMHNSVQFSFEIVLCHLLKRDDVDF
jgi:hypothetical protein